MKADKQTSAQAQANVQNAQVENATAKVASKNTTNTRVQAGTSYVERMRSHMTVAHTPSKAIKNAVATTCEQAHVDKHGALYAKAVAAVFDPKNAEQMKAALNALLARYKGTPARGYSEYYVHQYFERIIKENAQTKAECWNYLIYKIKTQKTDK